MLIHFPKSLEVHQYQSAGAKGVTFGRNIFAHKSPDKMVQALAGIIFRNETAEEAAKKIG
jgi:fructose-bisphosphate aldolase/2-amino-3,7-dideoxy-D-threo-hept-6-ulosonate synthase